MTFPKRSLLKAITLGFALSAISTVAVAQIPPPPPPPDTFIATAEPVYYEGHPAYYYNNHWYWRDGNGSWNYYHDEPAELRDHRMHAPPARHAEERRAPPAPRGRR